MPMIRLFWGLALALWASAASAAPSVFVRADKTEPWASGTVQARILGTSAGPVTAETLSAHIEETQIFYSYRVCALEAVQADTYVGVDRETQAEIDASRPHVAWRAEAIAPGGRKILGQSVVFEGCDDGPKGAALLVTDAVTGEILLWLPLGTYTDDAGREQPMWVLFMTPREEGDDALFSFSGCTECGARTYVYYDVTRRHIYTEYNGH